MMMMMTEMGMSCSAGVHCNVPRRAAECALDRGHVPCWDGQDLEPDLLWLQRMVFHCTVQTAAVERVLWLLWWWWTEME
jgi:hypothetical protein